MDIATIIGLLAASGLVFGTIFTGASASIFLNIPSLTIVVGGTLAVTLVQFTIKQFFGSFKVALKAFVFKIDPPHTMVEILIDLADTSRKGGILALEEKLDTIDDDFLKTSLQLCIDNVEPEVIESVMEKEKNLTISRHEIGQKFFKTVADMGPALGMIGTLVGLVQMLSNMSDPASIGPAMAVALLTTLYGSMMANLFALPIMGKLELRSQEESLIKSLVIEGIKGLISGINPRVLRDSLSTFLPKAKRNEEEE